MPFNNRQSSVRSTPRGLFGSSGAMTTHSCRSDQTEPSQALGWVLDHFSLKSGIPF
jgi:hypothetical protein